MMAQWFTLFNKELLEMWRNYKWIWIPITFIVLGVTDPLSTYYLPQIIDAVGGMPEGAVIELPPLSGEEVLLMSMNQLNLLGLLVIVLAFMGVIAAERKSGVAGMILVKPVPIASYITAKWASVVLIGWVAVFFGYLAGWYYTGILFEPVPFSIFIQSFLIFSYWYAFVLTLTIFYNCLFRVPGVVGFLTLLTVIFLNAMTNTLEQWMGWSPANLNGNAAHVLMTHTVDETFTLSAVVSFVIICALLLCSIYLFKNKELAA